MIHLPHDANYHQQAIKILDVLKPKNKSIYISGPMTGIPDLNKANFDQAEDIIADLKHISINPHKLVTKEQQLTGDWELFMKIDLTEMFKAGCLLMLPNWQISSGASWEFLNAKMLKIPVLNMHFEVEMLPEAEYMALLHNVLKKIQHNDISFNRNLLKLVA